jgi:hypothetical protein
MHRVAQQVKVADEEDPGERGRADELQQEVTANAQCDLGPPRRRGGQTDPMRDGFDGVAPSSAPAGLPTADDGC